MLSNYLPLNTTLNLNIMFVFVILHVMLKIHDEQEYKLIPYVMYVKKTIWISGKMV